jgi:hypothetical protein
LRKNPKRKFDALIGKKEKRKSLHEAAAPDKPDWR